MNTPTKYYIISLLWCNLLYSVDDPWLVAVAGIFTLANAGYCVYYTFKE